MMSSGERDETVVVDVTASEAISLTHRIGSVEQEDLHGEHLPLQAQCTTPLTDHNSFGSSSRSVKAQISKLFTLLCVKPARLVLRSAEVLIWTLLFVFVAFVLIRHRRPPAQAEPWNKIPVHRGLDYETKIRREALGLDPPPSSRRTDIHVDDVPLKNHDDLNWHDDKDFLDQHNRPGVLDGGATDDHVDLDSMPLPEWKRKMQAALDGGGSGVESSNDVANGGGGEGQRNQYYGDEADDRREDRIGEGRLSADVFNDDAGDGDEEEYNPRYQRKRETDYYDGIGDGEDGKYWLNSRSRRRTPRASPPLSLQDIKRQIRRLEMNEEFSLVQLRLKELEELKKQHQRIQDEYDFGDEQDAFRDKEREWQRVKWTEMERKFSRWLKRTRKEELQDLHALRSGGGDNKVLQLSANGNSDLATGNEDCPDMTPLHPFVPYPQYMQSLPDGSYAYVTYVSSSEFVPAAATLMHSIAVSGSQYARAICITEDVSQRDRDTLSLLGQLIVVEKISSPRYIDNPRYRETFTKLRIWQLAMYKRILYIDTDVVVTRNMDDLFDIQEWAVPMDAEQNRYSTGMMVCDPSLRTFDQMMEDLKTTTTSMELPDLLFLKAYFDNPQHQKKINIIPRWYQVYQEEFGSQYSTYLTNRKQKLTIFDTRIHGIHYPGAGKPWGNYAVKIAKYRPHFCNWKSADAFQYEPQFLWYIHHELMLTSLRHAKGSHLFDYEHGGGVIVLNKWVDDKKKKEEEDNSWRSKYNNNNNRPSSFWDDDYDTTSNKQRPSSGAATTANNNNANAWEWQYHDGKWVKVPTSSGGAQSASTTSGQQQSQHSTSGGVVADKTQLWTSVPGSCRFDVTLDFGKALQPSVSSTSALSIVHASEEVASATVTQEKTIEDDILQHVLPPQRSMRRRQGQQQEEEEQEEANDAAENQPLDALQQQLSEQEDQQQQDSAASSLSDASLLGDTSNADSSDSDEGSSGLELGVGEAIDVPLQQKQQEEVGSLSTQDSSSSTNAGVVDARLDSGADASSSSSSTESGSSANESIATDDVPATIDPVEEQLRIKEEEDVRKMLRQQQQDELRKYQESKRQKSANKQEAEEDGDGEGLTTAAPRTRQNPYQTQQRRLHQLSTVDDSPADDGNTNVVSDDDHQLGDAATQQQTAKKKRVQRVRTVQAQAEPHLDAEETSDVRRLRQTSTTTRAPSTMRQTLRRKKEVSTISPLHKKDKDLHRGVPSVTSLDNELLDELREVTRMPSRRRQASQRRDDEGAGEDDDAVVVAVQTKLVDSDVPPNRRKTNRGDSSFRGRTAAPTTRAPPQGLVDVEVNDDDVQTTLAKKHIPTTLMPRTTMQQQQTSNKKRTFAVLPQTTLPPTTNDGGAVPDGGEEVPFDDTLSTQQSSDDDEQQQQETTSVPQTIRRQKRVVKTPLPHDDSLINNEEEDLVIPLTPKKKQRMTSPPDSTEPANTNMDEVTDLPAPTTFWGSKAVKKNRLDSDDNNQGSDSGSSSANSVEDPSEQRFLELLDALVAQSDRNNAKTVSISSSPAAVEQNDDEGAGNGASTKKTEKMGVESETAASSVATAAAAAAPSAVAGAVIDFSLVPPLIVSLDQVWSHASLERYEWAISWCTKSKLRPMKTTECGKAAHVSQYSVGLCRTNFDESFEVLPIYALEEASKYPATTTTRAPHVSTNMREVVDDKDNEGTDNNSQGDEDAVVAVMESEEAAAATTTMTPAQRRRQAQQPLPSSSLSAAASLIEPFPEGTRNKHGSVVRGIAGVTFRSKVTLDVPLRAKWMEVVVRCDPSMTPHTVAIESVPKKKTTNHHHHHSSGTPTSAPSTAAPMVRRGVAYVKPDPPSYVHTPSSIPSPSQGREEDEYFPVVVNNTHPPHGRTYRIRLRSRCACLGGCDSLVNSSNMLQLLKNANKENANGQVRYANRLYTEWKNMTLGAEGQTTIFDKCRSFGRNAEACLEAKPQCDYNVTRRSCTATASPWLLVRSIEEQSYCNCTHVGGDAEKRRPSLEACQDEARAAGANVVNFVAGPPATTTASPPASTIDSRNAYERSSANTGRGGAATTAAVKKTSFGCFYKRCSLREILTGSIPLDHYVPGGPEDGLHGFDVYLMNPFYINQTNASMVLQPAKKSSAEEITQRKANGVELGDNADGTDNVPTTTRRQGRIART